MPSGICMGVPQPADLARILGAAMDHRLGTNATYAGWSTHATISKIAKPMRCADHFSVTSWNAIYRCQYNETNGGMRSQCSASRIAVARIAATQPGAHLCPLSANRTIHGGPPLNDTRTDRAHSFAAPGS